VFLSARLTAVNRANLLFGENQAMIRCWIRRLFRYFPQVREQQGAYTRLAGRFRPSLELLEDRLAPVINVAVVTDSSGNYTGYDALVAQLNADTYFNFSATRVDPSAVTTVAALNAYNVVVVGGSGSTQNGGYDTYESALRTWVEAGGGLVMTGLGLNANVLSSSATKTDLNAILPVQLTPGSDTLSFPPFTITPNATVHAVTSGIFAFTDNSAKIEYSSVGLSSGATSLATAGGKDVVVVRQPVSGRTVYLGEVYTGTTLTYNNAGLRSGMADQLLEQAVHWAANFTYTVSTVTDSADPGTLRDAITQVNAGKFDTIDFSAAGSIDLQSALGHLPTLSASHISIDGTSGPGYVTGSPGAPVVTLNGANLTAGNIGLNITGSNVTVKGLDIINFTSGSAIHIAIGSAGDVIQSDYIGIETDGATAAANGNGIFINSGMIQTCLIGGTTAAQRNIISGNNNGVRVDGGGDGFALGNTIEGNYIGTDASGASAVGNSIGVLVENASGNTVTGNVISGNSSANVEIRAVGSDGQANSNLVGGNFIGTDAAGNNALNTSTQDGVLIDSFTAGAIATDNTVGGTTAAVRNIISGNAVGVGISQVNGNFVLGNYIGTKASGAAVLANTKDGVRLDTANNNTVGGTAAGSGNVISGNLGRGITLSGAASNLIQGNFIGTDSGATLNLENGLEGMYITNGAHDNTVGVKVGDTAGANTIVNNHGGGVLVGLDAANPVFPPTADTSGGSGNLILANSIAHTGGIVLNGNGNSLQAAPVITNVTPAAVGGTTTINFTLANTTSGVSYRFEFFGNDANDPEGKTFLGVVQFTSNGGTLSGQFTSDISDPSFITATATNLQTKNTSPFSNAAAEFADTFNRSGSTLGGNWNSLVSSQEKYLFAYRRRYPVGGFVLQGNAAVSASGLAADEVKGLSLSNPTVQAFVDATNAAQFVGVLARVQANGDAYVAALTPSGVAEILLFHASTNTYSPVGTSKNVGVAAATLQLVVNGSNLSLYVNGSNTAAATFSDPSPLAAGGVGIISYGANGIIDNFSVNGS
jgi:hypothetical protein